MATVINKLLTFSCFYLIEFSNAKISSLESRETDLSARRLRVNRGGCHVALFTFYDLSLCSHNHIYSLDSLSNMSAKITSDVLIYINQPYRQFRVFGLLAVTYTAFMGVNFIVSPTKEMLALRERSIREQKEKLKKVREEELNSETEFQTEFVDMRPRSIPTPEEKLPFHKRLDWKGTFDKKNMIQNFKDRPYLNGGLLLASVAIVVGFLVYPRRQIHSITLLAGGDKVRFTLFSPWALKKPSELVLPLKDVSCVSGRDSKRTFSILKLRGYKMYHLVSLGGKAEFLQPQLYDKYLGYSRSWANK